MSRKKRERDGGLQGEVHLPGGIGGSFDVGSDVVDTVRKEVEWLVGQIQELIGQSGRAVTQQLKALQRETRKQSRKHRKANPTLADYLNSWVKEIDKRLKMGAKSYRKVMRQYKKSTHIRKHLKEEKIL